MRNCEVFTLTSESLTLCKISQLSTHNSGISTFPGVITHSTPLIVHADLNSAFIGYVTSCQPQLTSCTRNCVMKTDYSCNNNIGMQEFTHSYKHIQ